MSRNGSALFVALLVVLLGALVSVLATTIAATEIRAGAAWRDQQVAAAVATAALARSRESAEALFDSLVPGESTPIDSSVSLWRLGDSLALITAISRFRAGQEAGSVLMQAWRDSLAVLRLTAHRSRSRFHPIP